jgi:hypothetical protein
MDSLSDAGTHGAGRTDVCCKDKCETSVPTCIHLCFRGLDVTPDRSGGV